ncbi:HD domain-containing protein 3 [Candidatus Thiomargarita nelsonii]|uniref:HD domain-containing protein 3 n=1 Tax=Candidatus Thiomargarita nelsonii TaxID=1003181 RepID=A0A0A6NXK2_9GAMM|nr:HD domain-containing protein 3 [Candidatus Thiomargarita nelsonii]
MSSTDESSLFLTAIKFAAVKHRDQRRKDAKATPYINHPIEVADTLWQIGKVHDMVTIVGALLHDTLEDTDTTPEEIQNLFGAEVLAVVSEVTDDKRLPKQQRKLKQIEHAPHISTRAKQLKLADKICNVYDIAHSPPKNWSLKRRQEYLDWSEQVVAGLRGVNPILDAHYDATLSDARAALARSISV